MTEVITKPINQRTDLGNGVVSYVIGVEILTIDSQTPTPTPTPVPVPVPIPTDSPLIGPSSKGVFLGAMADHSGDEHTLPNMIQDFETLAKKPHSFYNITNNFFDPNTGKPGLLFPSKEANYCKINNKVPLIQLNPCIKTSDQNSLPPLTDMGPYTLANIAAGNADNELTMWLLAAKAFRTPILVIFGDEANGQWFSWNREGAQPFKDAFRHIVTLARNLGVTNVKWIYDVDITFDSKRMHDYYPGDDVVDILGGSAYGEDRNPKGCFSALDAYYTDWASIAPDKLYGVFEYGLGDPGDYRKTFEGLANDQWPKIKFMLVWSESKGSSMGPGGQGNAIDWTPLSLNAYQEAVSPSVFIGENLGLALTPEVPVPTPTPEPIPGPEPNPSPEPQP